MDAAKLISYVPAIIGVFIIGVVVLLNDSKSIKNRLFTALNFLCCAWLFCLFLADTTTNLSMALWTLRFGLLSSGFMFVAFYVFALYFPTKKPFNLRTQIVVILPGVVLAALSLTPVMVKTVAIRSFGVDPVDVSALYNVSDFVGLIYMLLGIGTLVLKYKKAQSRQKSQLTFVVSGLIIAILGNVFSNVIAARLNLDTKFIWAGSFSLFIFSVLVAYSMLYYQLFDIRAFVVRSAAYLLTVITLALLYVAPALYLVGVVILGVPFSSGRFILGVLVATVVAINYANLRTWFDGITARIFFRDAYDPARLLSELNKILASSVDVNLILRESSELISTSTKASFCFIVLKDTSYSRHRAVGYGRATFANEDVSGTLGRHLAILTKVTDVEALPEAADALKKRLKQHDTALVIRLTQSGASSEAPLGFMMLGYKKSGKPYDNRDIQTLASVADVMGVAVQNALHFEEIQNFNETLQERITEATAKLRRSNAKLKTLDETKDDFISMASHQLRTPLTSVKGYLSMVLEGDAGKLTPLQRKMLDQAFTSSQRMVFLIADLLNVSRLKTGKFVIEPTKVNLAKTVSDEIGQLKETAKARSLTLSYARPEHFPDLMLDETKIRQVIMNFIDNAIYYTPAGGTIRIELQDTEAAVELRVIDDGIGVPRSEQAHLFTKFYRAGNARQTRPDGTGLGLFMAKKVVLAQGGAIIFESHEGQGSTFGFMLPKAKLSPVAPSPSTKVVAEKSIA